MTLKHAISVPLKLDVQRTAKLGYIYIYKQRIGKKKFAPPNSFGENKIERGRGDK